MVWRNKNLKKVKVGRIRQMVFNLHNPECTQILEQACRVSQVIRPSILVIPYTISDSIFVFDLRSLFFLTLTIDDSSMSEFQECSQFILRETWIHPLALLLIIFSARNVFLARGGRKVSYWKISFCHPPKPALRNGEEEVSPRVSRRFRIRRMGKPWHTPLRTWQELTNYWFLER